MLSKFLAPINGQFVDLGNIISNQTSCAITLTTNDAPNHNYSMSFKRQVAIRTNDIKIGLNGYCLNGSQTYTFGPAQQSTYVGVCQTAGSNTGSTIFFSNDGSNWYGIGSTVFDSMGTGICFNGRIWVATAYPKTAPYNSLAYSYDGKTWVGLGNTIFSNYGACVAWNGTQFIAGGSGAVNTLAYSYDGIKWVGGGKTVCAYSVNGIGWNGNTWVAAGAATVSSGQIAYSQNGSTWTIATSGATVFTTAANAVAWNGTTWLAAGQGTNTLAYSQDGVAWSQVPSSTSYITTAGYTVAWSGSVWVAGGMGTNNMAYTYDSLGQTGWTALGKPSFNTATTNIKWTGTGFTAIGNTVSSGNSLAVSPNGYSWNSAINTLGITSTGVGGMEYNNVLPHKITIPRNMMLTGWLADNNAIAYSYDGINLNQINATSVFSTMAYDFKYNGTMWIAAGKGTNSLAYSYDGITWNGLGATIFTTQSNGINWNGTLWIAAGQGLNSLAYSYDGLLWVGLGTPVANFTIGNKAVWNGNYWLAIGSSSTNSAMVLYSTNGINWQNTGFSLFSSYGYGLCWTGSLWIIGGDGATNTMAYSPDGFMWVGLGNSIFGTNCQSIAWNGKIGVAVGSGANTIAYSYDCINWVGIGASIFTTGLSVCWNGTMWIAVGRGDANLYAYSYDGIKWVSVPTIPSNLVPISWNKLLNTAIGIQNNNPSKKNYAISDSGKYIYITENGGVKRSTNYGTSFDFITINNFGYYYVEPWLSQYLCSKCSSTGQFVWIATCTSTSTNGDGIGYSSNYGNSWNYYINNVNQISPNVNIYKDYGYLLNSLINLSKSGSTILFKTSLTSYALSTDYGNTFKIINTNINFTERSAYTTISDNGQYIYTIASDVYYANFNYIINENAVKIAILKSENYGNSFTHYRLIDIPVVKQYRYLNNQWKIEASQCKIICSSDGKTLFMHTPYFANTTLSPRTNLFISTNYGITWNEIIITTLPNHSALLSVSELRDIYISANGSYIAFSIYANINNTTIFTSIYTSSNYGITWNGDNITNIFPGSMTTDCMELSSDGSIISSFGNINENFTYYNSYLVLKTGTVFTTIAAVGTNYNVPPIPYIQHPTIAMGSGTNTIAYSDDGIAWRGLGNTVFTSAGHDVAWNGVMWVAVGAGGNTLAYSTDGLQWTGLGNTIFTTAANAVAWNGTYWLATGAGTNTLAYSKNGIQWTGLGRPVFSIQGYGIAWNGTAWVATGAGGNTLAYSTNSITWTGIGTSIFTANGYDVVSNGVYWVATGSGTNTLAYTSVLNGSSGWTAISGIFSTAGNGIAWNGNTWVAAGQGTNTLAYSRNATTWQGLGTSTFSTQGLGVCWNGVRFVAAGQGANTLAYSPDAINWYGGQNGYFSANTTQIFTTLGNCVASNPRVGIPVVQSQMVIANQGQNQLEISAPSYYQQGFNEISIKVEQNNIY